MHHCGINSPSHSVLGTSRLDVREQTTQTVKDLNSFEPDPDGARLTRSRCIRPTHVDRHRKGDEKGRNAAGHGKFQW